jgi:malonate transporter and related proteins
VVGARRIGKLTATDSTVLSLTLAFPNAPAIGVPLIPAVYGNGSAVSVTVAIAVRAATISPITLAAPILGFLVVAVNLVVPSFVDMGLTIFGATIAGTALFLTGLLVSAQRFN